MDRSDQNLRVGDGAHKNAWPRYAGAVVATLVAAALRALLHPILGNIIP